MLTLKHQAGHLTPAMLLAIERQRQAGVQQQSAATAPYGTDLIRPL